MRDDRIFSALIVASEERFVREELLLDACVYDGAILPIGFHSAAVNATTDLAKPAIQAVLCRMGKSDMGKDK